jgi:hypothetical protein
MSLKLNHTELISSILELYINNKALHQTLWVSYPVFAGLCSINKVFFIGGVRIVHNQFIDEDHKYHVYFTTKDAKSSLGSNDTLDRWNDQ